MSILLASIVGSASLPCCFSGNRALGLQAHTHYNLGNRNLDHRPTMYDPVSLALCLNQKNVIV